MKTLTRSLCLILLTIIPSEILFAGGSIANSITGNTMKADSISDQLANNILTPLIGLASMVAFVYFLFGIARFFVTKDQNDDARIKLRTHLMWGFLGLFIIFSIGGIISVISSFGGSFN